MLRQLDLSRVDYFLQYAQHGTAGITAERLLGILNRHDRLGRSVKERTDGELMTDVLKRVTLLVNAQSHARWVLASTG